MVGRLDARCAMSLCVLLVIRALPLDLYTYVRFFPFWALDMLQLAKDSHSVKPFSNKWRPTFYCSRGYTAIPN